MHLSPRVELSCSFLRKTIIFRVWSATLASLACLCAQSCLTLCNPVDCSPPGSSVHGISQARILEWVAISSSRGSSQPRTQTHVFCLSCIAGRFFTIKPSGKPQLHLKYWHFQCLYVQQKVNKTGPRNMCFLIFQMILIHTNMREPLD